MSRYLWFAFTAMVSVSAALGAYFFAFDEEAGARDPFDCDRRSVQARRDHPICAIQFGSEGEAWDPPMGAGGVTRDRNTPNLVTIRSGTTIDIQNAGAPHQIAIYDKGLNKNGTTNNLTTFRDITFTPGAGPVVINDPVGRLAFGSPGASMSYTFTTPGQYLIICAFRPHLENFAQATYVVVDDSVN
jgi:plastocyanin